MEKLETGLSKGRRELDGKMTRLKNRFMRLVTDPYSVATVIAIVVLVYLIVVPLWEMLSATFKLSPQDVRSVPGAIAGEFTPYYWKKIFNSSISEAIFYGPLKNSLFISLMVSMLSIILGGLMAWLVTRTDIPYKKFFSFMIIVPYMLPSWSKSLAWLTIFKNDRIGGYPGVFQYLFNINPPNEISYGVVPIIITATLHYYVFTYLLMSSALSSINGDMEEMAEITGANRYTILSKIVGLHPYFFKSCGYLWDTGIFRIKGEVLHDFNDAQGKHQEQVNRTSIYLGDFPHFHSFIYRIYKSKGDWGEKELCYHWG